ESPQERRPAHGLGAPGVAAGPLPPRRPRSYQGPAPACWPILAGPQDRPGPLALLLARHPAEVPRQHRSLLLVRNLVLRSKRVRAQTPAKHRAVFVAQVVEASIRDVAPRAQHVMVQHQLHANGIVAVRGVQALKDRALGGSNRHAAILTRGCRAGQAELRRAQALRERARSPACHGCPAARNQCLFPATTSLTTPSRAAHLRPPAPRTRRSLRRCPVRSHARDLRIPGSSSTRRLSVRRWTRAD